MDVDPTKLTTTDELSRESRSKDEQFFSDTIELLDPESFGTILLVTDGLTDRFRDQTYATYTSQHKRTATAMTYALDLENYQRVSVLHKESGDVSKSIRRVKAQYTDVSDFCVGVFEMAQTQEFSPGVVVRGAIAPAFLTMVKERGFKRVFQRSVRAKNAALAVQKQQYAFEQCTPLAVQEIRDSVDEFYAARTLTVLYSVGHGRVGKNLGLIPYVDQTVKQLQEVKKSPAEPAQKRAEQRVLFQAINNKLGSVLRKGVFITPDELMAQELVANLSKEVTEWNQLTSKQETAIHMAWLRIHGENSAVEPDTEPAVVLARKPADDGEATRKVEEIQGLLLGNTQLIDSYGVLLSDWRYSNTSLKDSGTKQLRQQLLLGSSGEDWELAGKPPDTVYRYLCIMVKLLSEHASQGLESTQNKLGEALTQEADLRAQNEATQSRLTELQGAFETSKNTQSLRTELHDDIEDIRGEWPMLSQLLATDSLGTQLFPVLNAVLFPAAEQNVPDEILAEAEIEDVVPQAPEEVEDSMIPEDEEPLFDVDPGLFAIAEQLDIIVFPSDRKKSYEHLVEDVMKHATSEDWPKIERWRLKLLNDMRIQTGGTLYRTKPSTFGTKTPWYVLHLPKEGQRAGLSIVEHPFEDNATYLVRDEYEGYWQELVTTFNRNEARNLGAVKVIHPLKEEVGRLRKHAAKLSMYIQDLLTAKTGASGH